MIKFLDCGVCTVWSSNDRLLCGNSEHVTLTSESLQWPHYQSAVCAFTVYHVHMLNSWCSSVYLHTRVCMISLHICLLQAHWSCGLGSKHRFWCEYPLYIYTHTSKHRHRSTVVTYVVAAWWNRTNLALVASCSASENLHRRNLQIFCQLRKKICRLHLCNADSVGNNVAVTLSSAFLVLATFTVCYWIIYDTLLYDLQLIKTYLFKALWVYFTDPKCIRMMDSDLIRPKSVMSLQVPFRYILDPFTVTYCPDKIRIHY